MTSPQGISLVRHRTAPALVVWVCLVFCLSGLTRAARAEEVVIVNPDVTAKELPLNALRAIFGMRLRTWPNGNRISVVVLNDSSPGHARFAKQTLAIFPHQLRLAWDRLVYSGTGQAPIEVASETEMRAKVASTTDAIGYLPVEMVNDSVRILQIK